jgi:hypothetical protein
MLQSYLVMKTKLSLVCLGLIGLMPASAAEISIGLDIRLGKVPPPPPPEVIVVEEKAPPGPPPWAPAKGFRRNHGYYYYPGADVYYRPEDRMWFFLEGSNWRVGATLPASIRVDFDHSVPLTMETDQPFRFHDDVKRIYPANYFVTKVKIKGPPVAVVDDAPGRGKGKGKGKSH